MTAHKNHERELETSTTLSAALRKARTRNDLLTVVLEQILELTRTDGAALITLLNTGEGMVEMANGELVRMIGVSIPAHLGIFAHVLSTGQIYTTQDLENDPKLYWRDLFKGLQAAVYVPLITEEKPIGALMVVSKHEIVEMDVRMLDIIADIAASAIQRTVLHEQTEHRVQQLTVLRTMDQAISGTMDLNVLLSALLGQVKKELGIIAADVLLLDKFTHVLEFAAGCDIEKGSPLQSPIRLGECIAGRVALERKANFFPNLTPENWKDIRPALLPRPNFSSYYVIPLITKGQVNGVLEVYHKESLTSDQDWLDFLEILAGQVGIAIENSTLFENLQRSNIELSLAYDDTIEGWSRALDLRDHETEGHTQRVTQMTVSLAAHLGIMGEELLSIRRGSLLHDIGKMGIPDHILLKPGALSDEEWVIMRLHPQYAFEMLAPIKYLKQSLDIPYCHHEHWDGKGYPRGLVGDQIPLAARIFAVVDVWDALTSDRPYRPAWEKEKVLAYIQNNSGSHFDPEIVKVFLKLISGY